MSEETKVAVDSAASQNESTESAKKSDAKAGGGKTEKKVKYSNPFSFTDPLQDKLVTCIMKDGKKVLAQKILKDTFDEMHRRGEDDPLKTFETALKNATPTIEVRPKRIGGAVYQIPIEVGAKRQQSLCVRWILEGARNKGGQPMYRRLAAELIDAANEAGHAVTKKKEVHRMAQANKAFAHLARY